MEPLGPCCPACGARVKLPKITPLPPPRTKVKCPSCSSVGELEAFLRAAAGETDSGFDGENLPEDPPAAETVPNLPASRPRPDDDGGGTRISGSSTELKLPPGLRCTLTVLGGPDSGRKMSLTRPRVVVGRDNGDFPLSDPEVSREHCAFEVSGVTCTVRDLGSRNGTFVDGEKIASHQLGNVGEVTVGNTMLLFTMTIEDAVMEG